MLWNTEYKSHDDIRQHLQGQQEGNSSDNITAADDYERHEIQNIEMRLDSQQNSANLQTNLNMLRRIKFAKGQLQQMMNFLQASTQIQHATGELQSQEGQEHHVSLCPKAILHNTHDVESDLALIQSISNALKDKECRVELECNILKNDMLYHHLDSNRSQGSDETVTNTVKARLDAFINSMKFSTDKLFVAERYRDIFCDTVTNAAVAQDVSIPLTFITGQAGAGKTYLLNAISEMSKITSSVSKGALKLTHTGVAATTCEGYTLYILSIPITLNACGIDTTSHQVWKSLPIERVVELQDQYDFKDGRYSMVILDEFPTIDPVNFTAIEKRISQLFP
jgi:hypothetical protein